VDRDLFLPATPPFVVAGGSDFDSEKLVAYELGYRVRPLENLTVSLAGFYNDYDQIRSLDTNTFVLGNNNRAQEWGLEISSQIQPASWWRLRGGYTFLEKNVEVEPGAADLNRGRAEGNDPEQQFMLQSMFDLPGDVDLGFNVRYIDRLPSPPVSAYFSFDVRVAWRPVDGVEISIVGQNLWDAQHAEFGAPATRQEIPRSVYGKVTWSF
jgi:iron complex outermembrane receptor protein